MLEGYRPRVRLFEIVIAAIVSALVAHSAFAQGPKAQPVRAGKAHGIGGPPAKRSSAVADGGVSVAPTGGAAMAPVAGGPNDAGVVEAKTLDGGTRVFKFTELDIEGRLKSPQLVYFLRRVRAEFAAGELGHRSFLREMSETRRESTF